MDKDIFREMMVEHSELCSYLFLDGFKAETGVKGEVGLTKRFPIAGGLYYLWITVNPINKRIYVYKKHDSGTCIENSVHLLSENSMSNYSKFKSQLMIIINNYM